MLLMHSIFIVAVMVCMANRTTRTSPKRSAAEFLTSHNKPRGLNFLSNTHTFEYLMDDRGIPQG